VGPDGPDDFEDVRTLYQKAFPDEDLSELVLALWQHDCLALSLAAKTGSDLVGHAFFTACSLSDNHGQAALLGPIAVRPDLQRRGFGRRLIEQGEAGIAKQGVSRLFVLGDPAYYGRLGFTEESAVSPPYPLPDQWLPAWQSKTLLPKPSPDPCTLQVPPPWQNKVYWT